MGTTSSSKNPTSATDAGPKTSRRFKINGAKVESIKRRLREARERSLKGEDSVRNVQAQFFHFFYITLLHMYI